MKIIAESAFNHQGSIGYLKSLALASKESNADYFTVQVMNVDAFCVKSYSKYGIYKDTVFSLKEWTELFTYCKSIEMEVIPCVLDEESFEFCYNIGFRFMKIHGTDIVNIPFLELIKSYQDVKLILETQCATNFEVNYAIETLGKNRIEALFSGFSNYPTEIEDINLNSIDTLKVNYKLDIGYADHSLDTSKLPLMILAKGCKYIEKHITLSRNDRHFDWQVSLYPEEFKIMVNTIKHYSKSLGNGVKHPQKNELAYRNIMYKKVLKTSSTLKRSDEGDDYMDHLIKSFSKNKTVVAIIARLKSKRLKNKVLKQFHKKELILNLYERISTGKNFSKVVLATSNLKEDKPLIELFKINDYNFFEGDPISVIDRLLDLAVKEKASSIFRVTGDNVFTDPMLMDQMVTMMNENNLDYVKINNAPFGVGAELFSTEYLWKLYLKINNPQNSEYLTWYVLNDENVNMGVINLESEKNRELINLSIDYQEDLERCKRILANINPNSFKDITLGQIYSQIEFEKPLDNLAKIKLPEGNSIQLKEYLNRFHNKKTIIKKNLKVL